MRRYVSGDFATTANFALVVSGVPTSGENTNASGASGASGSTPGGASSESRCVPSPTPPSVARSSASSSGSVVLPPSSEVDDECPAEVAAGGHESTVPRDRAQPPASAAMNATSSPSASGSSGSRAIWSPFRAASTCASSVIPIAAAAAPSVAARTSAGGAAQRAEAADAHGAARARRERALVVLARVQVAHALGMGEVVEPARVAALEQERGLHPVRRRRARRRAGRARCGRRRRAAGGSRRVRHGGVGVARAAAHTAATKRGCRNGMSVEATNASSPSTASSPASRPCSGPCPRARPRRRGRRAGSARQLLAGRADDDDRPADAARDDPAGPAQQRRAVPVQPRLRRAHAARAAAREHDPGRHPASVPRRTSADRYPPPRPCITLPDPSQAGHCLPSRRPLPPHSGQRSPVVLGLLRRVGGVLMIWIGHESGLPVRVHSDRVPRSRRARGRKSPLCRGLRGVSDGTRTRGRRDHNP